MVKFQRRTTKKRTMKKSRKTIRPSSTFAKAVTKVIDRKAETKFACFYQSYNPGTTTPSTGFYGNRGWAVQNQLISSNATDILRLITKVNIGTSQNSRIGEQITPLSLAVKGAVRVAYSLLAGYTPTNIKVVIYVLQHVSLKDYTNLQTQNDFTQLLMAGDSAGPGFTTPFNGEVVNADMPVNTSTYRVLKKKIVTLRYAGADSGTGNPPTNFSVANAHNYYGEFTFSLSKSLPKSLKYGESVLSTDPTNSSIFMCMGSYEQDALSLPPSTITPLTFFEQTYMSTMKYKDM